MRGCSLAKSTKTRTLAAAIGFGDPVAAVPDGTGGQARSLGDSVSVRNPNGWIRPGSVVHDGRCKCRLSDRNPVVQLRRSARLLLATSGSRTAGAKIVRQGRYVSFQLAGVAIPPDAAPRRGRDVLPRHLNATDREVDNEV